MKKILNKIALLSNKSSLFLASLILIFSLSACNFITGEEQGTTPVTGDDGSGDSGNINHAPDASSQALSAFKNIALPISLTATDADSDPLTYVIISQPPNGTIIGTVPNITYTPNPGYIGSDSFTFKVNDGTVDSGEATVAIAVNQTVLYFCDKGDSLWASTVNWYLSDDCSTTPANRIPLAEDSVVISTGTFTDQPATISLLTLIGELPTNGANETQNISIAANGVLTVTCGKWYGASDATATTIFNTDTCGTSENLAIVSGDARFDGDSRNLATVEGNANFYNYSSNNEGATVKGNATFYNFSFNDDGAASAGPPSVVEGNATFYDSSYNGGANWTTYAVVWGSAFFHNDSYNSGQINGDATFYDSTSNPYGYVIGTGEFYGSSSNPNSSVGVGIFHGTSVNNAQVDGQATFYDSSQNDSGWAGSAIFNDFSSNTANGSEIYGDATFNGNSTNEGIVDGNAIFNVDSSDLGTVYGSITCNTSGTCVAQ